MKIKKVLNSSVILAMDEQGKEFVCFGKGIGYNRKIGDIVEKKAVDQIFRPIENNQIKEYLELLESIPPIYLEITQKIIAQAERELDCKLNVNIYFTLTDHLHFAVERAKKNINITNRVYWEIKNYYPIEFKIGMYTLELLNKSADVTLPDEEAANIAFHIINAQSEVNDSSDGIRYAKLIGEIVNLVRYSIGTNLEEKGVHYQRFITHVKFFAERFFKNKMLKDENDQMFYQIETLYPESMKTAFKISEYLKKVYNEVIPKDELTYLAVHINRLQRYSESDE
ncbi:PRD domain-containing protein [Clostridiaceae bacterium UIB06]|uniref:PRD domain-containing protein n=1 Tax=Clostridium thailandense TaxID=2794346 RepID=A0A949TXJ1_9CLOT|nr:PRD domain-containing protein [Clostridium thailandense]MBV7273691.1 PRD domain-containing protein [Clostridium thailandense]MCH5137083.1 PRD domain-containing protein [Clostridiaceae bacterium UIB06]